MRLLENEDLQSMVDYSFGDQSGVLGGVPNAYMKKANINNQEFRNKLDEVFCSDRRVMTLFIDNIRLYKRDLEYSDWLHMKPIKEEDKRWLAQFDDEDLLAMLGKIRGGMRFVIFTAFEDTPLDEEVFNRIPPNVLSINSANGVVFGGKVHPFPHGIERKMYEGYNHHELLLNAMAGNFKPNKALLVAHREDTGDRKTIASLFQGKEWATVTHLPYEKYIEEIGKHKFVLCPSGNGIGSSRNWETLYMKRVPIMEDHPYKRELFKDLPVLFVKDFSEVTEELLLENEYLFKEAQKMDMSKLDLDTWFTIALSYTTN